mgnify:CR=1 FL=1
MAFFEDLAVALDAEGIESRGDGDTLFVPITSELEIQFVEIDPHLPAANVYIAAADVDEDDEDFEAVLVAVELALESAPPSGRVSCEHVVNVLARLQAQPLPETVATILQVSQSPLANTARYDSLRAGSDVQEADHA